jgi:hypothetical protein
MPLPIQFSFWITTVYLHCQLAIRIKNLPTEEPKITGYAKLSYTETNVYVLGIEQHTIQGEGFCPG